MINATCFANIAADEIALGGLVPNTPMSVVKKIYGQPLSYYRGHADYGNGFTIYTMGGNEAWSISTTQNNGIATPAGVIVGMNADVLNRVYGKADSLEKDNTFGGYIYHYYSPDLTRHLQIYVKDDIITRLECHVPD